MTLFNQDKIIYGKYAAILRKYSASHSGQDSSADQWKLSNGEENARPVVLFNAAVDLLYAAASLALARGLKLKELPVLDRKDDFSILAQAWKKRQSDFLYLYRLMILLDPDLPLDEDERVRKAFRDVQDDEADREFSFFLMYAYAGLDELDRMLSETQTYTDLANLASGLVLEYHSDDEEEEE